MTCASDVLLDMEPLLAAVAGVADMLDTLSVAAESVNLKPGELALLADVLHGRHNGLLGLLKCAIEMRAAERQAAAHRLDPPGMTVSVMASKLPPRCVPREDAP